jgi:hypothetical protein
MVANREIESGPALGPERRPTQSTPIAVGAERRFTLAKILVLRSFFTS